MDKIVLKNMMFYGYHGVHLYEQQHGQRLYFDLELTLDLEQAGQSDDLTKTVDYTKVYDKVRGIVEKKQYKLLETLAHNIAEAVLAFEAIQKVIVRVRKPLVPIPGQIDYMEIEIVRGKI